MKKSLRRKLIMSAVAVGAAALATTSSTYAWFVTNTTVETNKVNGNVVAANANLSISATQDGTYGVTATPALNNSTLTPVTKAAGADFGKFINVSGQDVQSGWADFTLWFKVDNLDTSKNNYLQITKAVSTDNDVDSKPYSLIKDAVMVDGGAKVNAGSSIKEDVTKSLILSYQTDTSGNACVNQPLNTAAATYDGIRYYNDVTQPTTPVLESKATFEAGFGAAGAPTTTGGYQLREITSADKFSVTFYVWLDGADKACFDVVASHAWDLALSFKLVTTPKSQAK